MIQTYSIIKKQISVINQLIDESTFIQKVYSSSYFICFNLRKPGQSIYFYIGRGKGYEGIWIGSKNVPSELRKIDRFLEYLRRHVSNCRLINLDLDEKDRIIKINYHKWGHQNSLYLFYKGRDLFFMNNFMDKDKGEYKCMRSWNHKNKSPGSYACFDEIGRKKLENDIINEQVKSIESLLELEGKFTVKKSSASKKQKFLKRKFEKIKKDLWVVRNKDDLINLVEENEDLSSLDKKIIVGDHKLSFKEQEHYKRRDEIYLKIKKLKKAEKILSKRFEDTAQQMSQKNEVLESNLKAISPVWKNIEVESIDSSLSEAGYKEYILTDFKFAIGLSARGNDQLRKVWANKDDTWFHLDGEVSAHAIVKLSLSDLSLDQITIIGSCILDHTGKKSMETDIVYTQVKNVKGIKGTAGLVNYKKEKRIRIVYNPNWRNQ